MKNLTDSIKESQAKKRAIAHFNTPSVDMIWAIFQATLDLSKEAGEKIPVLFGASEGERKFFGTKQFPLFIKSLREEYDHPVFSSADHTYDPKLAEAAIDAGFDLVVFDAAKEDLQTNLKTTKACVDYAKSKNSPALIEAELGFIGSGSDLKDEIPEGTEAMTEPDEAKDFVQKTGIDLLAPSVGNIHGMVKTGNPHLDAERITQIREATGVSLVLHGGSGISDDDFVKGVEAGIGIIHISTELRVAYRKALEKSLEEADDLAPYKYLKPSGQAVYEVAKDRIKLFSQL